MPIASRRSIVRMLTRQKLLVEFLERAAA